MCHELEAKFIDLCEKNEFERVLKLGNNSDDSSDEFEYEESKRSQTIGSKMMIDSESDLSSLSNMSETEYNF